MKFRLHFTRRRLFLAICYFYFATTSLSNFISKGKTFAVVKTPSMEIHSKAICLLFIKINPLPLNNNPPNDPGRRGEISYPTE